VTAVQEASTQFANYGLAMKNYLVNEANDIGFFRSI
jgi:hypothetical protein